MLPGKTREAEAFIRQLRSFGLAWSEMPGKRSMPRESKTPDSVMLDGNVGDLHLGTSLFRGTRSI